MTVFVNEKSKDGYIASCPLNKCLTSARAQFIEEMGKPSYSKLTRHKKIINPGHRDAYKQQMQRKYQYLKCSSCNKNTEGQMTICEVKGYATAEEFSDKQ